ncbi:MAG: hypothetical protein RJA22_3031 [Verrucomicrobiota bacterium]|jgi:hypothetical protein
MQTPSGRATAPNIIPVQFTEAAALSASLSPQPTPNGSADSQAAGPLPFPNVVALPITRRPESGPAVLDEFPRSFGSSALSDWPL